MENSEIKPTFHYHLNGNIGNYRQLTVEPEINLMSLTKQADWKQ